MGYMKNQDNYILSSGESLYPDHHFKFCPSLSSACTCVAVVLAR